MDLMDYDNKAPKVTQADKVDGQQEDNVSIKEELSDEQQSAVTIQDETQTDDCMPPIKRIKVESDTKESASRVSSYLSRDDEAAIGSSSIVLTELLPKKVPVASLNNPDELAKKLVNVLQPRLRKIQSLPEELNLLDFTLPEQYCQQIQSNLPLLGKIIVTCTQHLVSKGVKSVTEVLLPPINIDKMEMLFSLDKWYQSLKLDFLKCAVEAAEMNEIYMHLVPILTALQSCQVKDVQLCGPVLQAPKAIKKQSAEWKELMKKVKEKKFTDEYLSKFSLGSVRLGSKPGGVAAKKWRRSNESIKKPSKREKKATAGKESNYLEFTTDAILVPLSQASHHMSAYEYWDLEEIHKQYTGKGTVLAILDSGVMDIHDAFLGTADKFSDRNYWGPSGDTLDHDGHGTLCAGIAGGNSFKVYENPEDPASQLLTVKPGVAPGAKLVICKVTEGKECIASVDVVIDALKAIKVHNESAEPCNKIDVVSISMGCYAFSASLAQAISDLVNQGVIIICAASNDGHKFHTPICFPARLGNVICVGSHGVRGKSSLFSPTGQELDFLAPGENILGPGNLDYMCEATWGSGTSFAVPAVAGLVCLILECLQKSCPKKASQFHNHWVMKDLLREMSTNGGTHANDRGFGTLTPIRFFRNPERFIDIIDFHILHQSKEFF